MYRYLPLILLFSCSGLEQSEHDKTRRQNAKGEFIYRTQGETSYPVDPPTPRTRDKYPWEA